MTVPHILLKQVQIYQPELQLTTAVDMCNRINEKIDAYNKEQEQPLISAQDARKLGAGNAEWLGTEGIWAELKPLYEQQFKNGTLDNFVWEWKSSGSSNFETLITPVWFSLHDAEYRCTPKPTCQVRNLDTGELKTMTREAAKLLQAEAKERMK